jgi:hypothetical protein
VILVCASCSNFCEWLSRHFHAAIVACWLFDTWLFRISLTILHSPCLARGSDRGP